MLKTLLRGALALALMIAPASAQQVWKWSTTPATNSNVDPSISWVTGMAPSQVSPSARGMMAGVAKYRDDIGGRLTTGGTSTAYTLTSNSSLASTPNNGQLICFTVNATNGASPTLAVDSGTAFPIRTDASNAVPAATLISGSPYCAVFNSSASAWILHGYYGSPTTIPIGGLIAYTGAAAPNSNFALANGQAVSRTTYAALFSLVGTTFGTGDGSTTFNLPDLSNRVVAGTAMGGTSRITVAGGNFDGTVLGATGGAQNHTLTTSEMPTHTHAGTTDGTTVSGTTSSDGSHNHTGTTSGETATHTHSYNTAANKSVAIGTGGGAITINIWNGSDTAATSGADSNTHAHTINTDGAHTHTFNAGSHTHTFTTGSAGSGAAHTILPPVMTLPMLIRIF